MNGGRQLFNQNARTEVTYSIVMDGKVYFIALADGSVHSIQLIERSI